MDANGRPYAEMTVAQLKQELEARGIDTKVNRSAEITYVLQFCKLRQVLCVPDAGMLYMPQVVSRAEEMRMQDAARSGEVDCSIQKVAPNTCL
jgi:hypothetical protein